MDIELLLWSLVEIELCCGAGLVLGCITLVSSVGPTFEIQNAQNDLAFDPNRTQSGIKTMRLIMYKTYNFTPFEFVFDFTSSMWVIELMHDSI